LTWEFCVRAQDKLTFMNDIVVEALGRKQPMAFLSGPSFAKELMDEQPTGSALHRYSRAAAAQWRLVCACRLVCASEDLKLAKQVQDAIISPRIRVYTTTDVVGVEVGSDRARILP
jgi:glycerol-3-phosphate dehydrogenase (NAD+)